MARPKRTRRAPLSAEEIREIVGRLSDERIAAIQGTGATAAEVVEAFTWLSSDECAAGRRQPPVTGVVAEVYDILKPDLPETEDEHPRPA